MSIPPPPIGIPAPPGGLYPPPIRNGIATEVLLDRGVPLIDEVAEFIKQSGGPSLASILDSLRETAPAEANARERHAASQRAMASEILRYRSHVEAPAAAALRERKAASPSAVLKVGSGGRDSVVLAALEPDLTRLSCPPRVSSLALRVSPELSADAAHKYRGCALVAGADHNMIAMYVGPYRPGIPSPGFYLVYNSWANSLAAVPQLPSSSISWFSHRAVGSVAAVLRHAPPSDYILSELLTRNDSRGLPTNNATLCMWWSSGPVARRWILKEVVLPLPSSSTQGYTFCADTVFAAGYASLCWVDLLMGILMCEDMLAPDPSFRFIPLPEEYRTRPYPSCGRGFPEEYRSMSYHVDPLTGRHAIKFVNLDGYCQDRPAEDVMLTTWSLDPSDLRFLWHKDESFRIGDLMFLQDLDRKMPRPLVARFPLLSVVDSDIVYLNMSDEKGQIGGYNVVVERGMVVKLTEHSGSPHKFVSPFSMFIEETDLLKNVLEKAPERQEQEEDVEPWRCIDAPLEEDVEPWTVWE